MSENRHNCLSAVENNAKCMIYMNIKIAKMNLKPDAVNKKFVILHNQELNPA